MGDAAAARREKGLSTSCSVRLHGVRSLAHAFAWLVRWLEADHNACTLRCLASTPTMNTQGRAIVHRLYACLPSDENVYGAPHNVTHEHDHAHGVHASEGPILRSVVSAGLATLSRHQWQSIFQVGGQRWSTRADPQSPTITGTQIQFAQFRNVVPVQSSTPRQPGVYIPLIKRSCSRDNRLRM